MLKSTFGLRDVQRNGGPEEKDWRSSSNRPQTSVSKTSLVESSACQKRKNLSSVSQAKHVKRKESPGHSDDETSLLDCDDDPPESEIPYHSQESNCDSSFSFSILDIGSNGRPSSSATDNSEDSRTISPIINDIESQGNTAKESHVNHRCATPSINGYLPNRTTTPSPNWYSENTNISLSDIKLPSTPPPPVPSKPQIPLGSSNIQQPDSVSCLNQFNSPGMDIIRSAYSGSTICSTSSVVNPSDQHLSASYVQNMNGYSSVQYTNSSKANGNNAEGNFHPSVSFANTFPSTSVNTSRESSPSFLKQLQQEQQRRSSEVFKNVHGQQNFQSSVTVETFKLNKENCIGSVVSISRFEPPSKTPESNIGSIVPTKKVSLHPSTYAENSYYKNELPHVFLERNDQYANSNLRTCLSNSYDNLSDTDSVLSFTSNSTLSPPKARKRYSLPIIKKTETKLCDNLPDTDSLMCCMPNSTTSPPKGHHRYSFPVMKKTAPPEVKLIAFESRYRRSVSKYNLMDFFSNNMLEKVIDTHCHLDFLFQKENHRGTFEAYKDKNRKDFLSCFGGCVANFVEPFFFTKRSNWEGLLKEKNVWASFGVHPHFCYRYDEAVEESLLQAIKHDKVVAMGEIGLDYSSKNNCNKALQQQIFERQLVIAVKHKMPLIIHCRDAQEDCLRILTKVVPSDAKIHRHCFTGNWTEAKEWLDHFPNLYLGFTSLVTFKSVGYLHEVVRLTPTNRLLFETDAPYFVPLQVSDDANSKDRKVSNPGMVVHVAAQIAAIKGITDFPSFLATVRQNTRNMYSI